MAWLIKIFLFELKLLTQTITDDVALDVYNQSQSCLQVAETDKLCLRHL